MTPDLSSSCRLNGSIAVVTGAAQGLGLGIVEKLARSGATAIIADLQEATAKVEAEKLRKQGLSVDAAYLDVTDSTAVRTFFTDLAAQHGHLDILVNNAGVGQKVDPIVETTDQEWDRVISATLTSAFYCSRAAGGIMEDQESGCIVNISSINGQNPAALVGAYNVAKAGIISLTQTLAIELAAYSVRVNAICPGPVYTDFHKLNMAQRCQTLNITEEEVIERIRSAIPLGRWGNPIDIAQAVAFLCSTAASWITGEVLRVSGGLAGFPATLPKQIKT